MEPGQARVLWHRLESINAVTYFSPECREAPAALGLQGFWMGYFAGRAAPMGPVSAPVVEATFAGFHPARVRRAIPEAWELVDPDELVGARSAAAAAALRRLAGADEVEALADVVRPWLQVAVDHGATAGRPLFAANREVHLPADPVAALWQAATTLREHRGDGHVALLAGADLDGLEAHVLFAACEAAPPELYLQSRGWSEEEWRRAVERLLERGLLALERTPSAVGRATRDAIEARTDELATQPYDGIPDDQVQVLLEALEPAARRVAASGEISFPNPMGLPAPR